MAVLVVAEKPSVARAEIVDKATRGRFEAELDAGGGDYLVGDEFTVADLTAAALLAPAVQPPEGPKLPEPPPAYERFLAPLRERRAFEWVKQTFARHRSRPD